MMFLYLKVKLFMKFVLSKKMLYLLIQLGSRIRASVALTSFDSFHRYSAKIINTAVFGNDSQGNPATVLKFHVNNLVS